MKPLAAKSRAVMGTPKDTKNTKEGLLVAFFARAFTVITGPRPP